MSTERYVVWNLDEHDLLEALIDELDLAGDTSPDGVLTEVKRRNQRAVDVANCLLQTGHRVSSRPLPRGKAGDRIIVIDHESRCGEFHWRGGQWDWLGMGIAAHPAGMEGLRWAYSSARQKPEGGE